MSVQENVAIISGASRGIGRATAKRFLEAGWQVINLSRSRCDIAGVENIAVNFLANNFLKTCGDELNKHLKDKQTIALVHNAFYFVKDSSQNVEADSFAKVFQTAISAPSQLNRLLLQKMKPSSCIIYIGS